jgi:hypothetical protein
LGPVRPEPDATEEELPDAGVEEEVPATATGRTNATRVPSGDGTMLDSACGVVHTADAALPSIGTRQRSPFLGSINDRPSRLQKPPASDAPASGSSRGPLDGRPASTTYTLDTPARSQTKTTWPPSGAHMGFDG